MEIPRDLMTSFYTVEKGNTSGDSSILQGQTVAGQGVTYSEHKDQPREESNPMGNPEYIERVNRDALLKNVDDLSRLELVRLSRLSYLQYANRYNVREAVPVIEQ